MTSKDERFIIGQRILDIAKKKKISQEALAEKLGMKQTSVCSWGKTSGPPLEKIEIIAQILETDLEYLITGRKPVVKANFSDLTEKEKNILRMFRTLKGSRQSEFITHMMAFNFDELDKG